MIKENHQKFYKRILIPLLLILFLINAASSLIKFPELQRYFLSVYDFISASTLARWHDYSGLILIVLIIIHLAFNWKWFGNLFKSIGEKNFFGKKGRVSIFYGLLIIIILAAVILFVFMALRPKPIILSGVEIKNYQGEKLGSVNDFRENSIKGPQYIDQSSYRLEIVGLVSSPTSYSYDDVLKLSAYQKVVTINCVEGWSVKVLWEGVLVKDLLKNLTISPEAKTIIFYAVDGYSTSFPLDYVLNNNIIMADKMNGVILPPERGFPFQLVAEQKWGYKWIKWINKIELSSDTNYKGFWESNGYNNDGDLNGSKFAR